jgi:hypothetical protein
MKSTWGALLVFAAAGAFAALTESELSARFYYDLGPAETDVSGYPDSAKKGYAYFLKTCSRCHSPARAINSPLAKREDWERFVKRMHIKAKSKKGAAIGKAEAAAIVDFLTYDSKVRKLDQKEKFDALDREMRERFKAVQAERERRLREDGDAKARPPAPYTGAKP